MSLKGVGIATPMDKVTLKFVKQDECNIPSRCGTG